LLLTAAVTPALPVLLALVCSAVTARVDSLGKAAACPLSFAVVTEELVASLVALLLRA
jgi:hypothetical protein